MTTYHEKPSILLYETGVLPELVYPETLLTGFLEFSAMKDPESTALIFMKNSLMNET